MACFRLAFLSLLPLSLLLFIILFHFDFWVITRKNYLLPHRKLLVGL